MPEVEALLDSNVLIYALPRNLHSMAKQIRAKELIATTNFGLSFQVLQEVYVTVTRKIERPLAPADALGFLLPFLSFPLAAGSSSLFLEAANLAERFQIHYYDAAIIAAAQELEAPIVFSEDLNDGQDYAGVKVINPFRGLD